MFRRRSASASEGTAAAAPAGNDTEAPQDKGYTPKKGVPTPKRSQSQADLRRPLNAPQSRKEAYREFRERRDRDQKRAASKSGAPKGQERYFRPQDYGPARAYARDMVDSRRSLSEFFLYFSLLIIVLLIAAPLQVQAAITYIGWPVMMATIIIEGVLVARRVKKYTREHFPNDDRLRGIGMYAATRQLQIRRLRLPKPRLKPGQPVPPPA
ncbi:DUF3043 domain-containing protein [Nocardiopsis coralliicola]